MRLTWENKGKAGGWILRKMCVESWAANNTFSNTNFMKISGDREDWCS